MTLMLIMMRFVGECNGSEDNDLFLCALVCLFVLEESPPAALTVQLCYFSLIHVLFLFLCLCRLTWSQRERCTWSSICLDPPPKVKPPQHTILLVKGITHENAHEDTHACSFRTAWHGGICWGKVQQRCAKPGVMSL